MLLTALTQQINSNMQAYLTNRRCKFCLSQSHLLGGILRSGPIRKFCGILVEGRKKYGSFAKHWSWSYKEGSCKGFINDDALSIIGGPLLSKSSWHKGVIFAVKFSPQTPPKTNISKRCFKCSVYLLDLSVLNFYICLGFALNIK